MRSILIVRLGALGDLVHALPAAAALRKAFPDARLDWLANVRHRALLDLVPVIDRRIYLRGAGMGDHGPGVGSRHVSPRPAGLEADGAESAAGGGLLDTIRLLRRTRYDAAFDLQGLGKSAVLARLSGARRVIGFPKPYLREAWARFFYTATCDPGGTVHVIDKNLSALAVVGISARGERAFPLEIPASPIVDAVRALVAGDFAILNPGGGWPNKRWPPERFAAIAAALRDRHGLGSVVLAGPGEHDVARTIADRSDGAAVAAPATTIVDVLHLARAARLVVSGDTGPLHLAAAVGAPIVGIYGPTSPARNGPWDARDVCLSRFETCVCHHKRRCRRPEGSCLQEIGVEEVLQAIERRLAAVCGCR